MPNLKYVQATRYPNKCAGCGKTIPANSEAYWNGLKGKEGLNYHLNCNPHHVNAVADTPNPPASASDAKSAGAYASSTKQSRQSGSRVSPVGVKSVLQGTGSDEAPAFDVLANLKGACDLAASPELQAEIMRESFELWLLKEKYRLWGGKM